MEYKGNNKITELRKLRKEKAKYFLKEGEGAVGGEHGRSSII